MNNPKKVFRLAPDIYTNNETMLEIYNRENEEIDTTANLIVQAFLNNFVKYCDLEGIRKFEKIFSILADEINDSMELRKSRIINKFAQHLPYTKIFLRNMLNNIFGEDKVELEILYNEYKVKVDIETNIEGLFEQTMKDLRDIIPANMLIEKIITQPYMHKYLKKYFTHDEMKQFTYGELSKYA